MFSAGVSTAKQPISSPHPPPRSYLSVGSWDLHLPTSTRRAPALKVFCDPKAWKKGLKIHEGGKSTRVRCFAGHAAERLSVPEPVTEWPRTFDADFDVGDTLGRGGFGLVKLVVHKATQREAAVKIIPKVRKDVPEQRVMHRIREEVDFLEHVQARPEALQLLGVYEERGHLKEWETAKIAHDILRVLCECHRQNICYADVKPANFLLKEPYHSGWNEDGPQVKVADFGCSQRFLKGERLHKMTGTPLYMAPEIFLGYFGVESDMWSLGMMLYQLLVGDLPFWRDQEQRTPSSVRTAIIGDVIPFGGPEWRHVSPEGIHFLRRLLDRDFNNRMTAEEALRHPWIS